MADLDDYVVCEECAAEGEESKVYAGTLTSDCLAIHPHFDEEGMYHCHDPNTYRRSWSCSRGHTWATHARRPCPACGFVPDPEEVADGG